MSCSLPTDEKATAIAKKELRLVMQSKRSIAHTLNPQASYQMRDLALKNIVFKPNSKIASYHNFGSEISPLPLTDALRRQGSTILLPVIMGQSLPLVFRVHNTNDPLIPGPRGILEPPSSAPQEIPDILLVPLLAFNHDLYRLGYGGGYYDRTLSELRKKTAVTAIGIAFACQKVPELPLTPFDSRLDKIVTEVNFFN